MNKTLRLEKEVWRSETYFLLAKKGSMDIDHPGMKILKKISRSANDTLGLSKQIPQFCMGTSLSNWYCKQIKTI